MKICTYNPEFGYRYIYQKLLEDGFAVGKDQVLKYMRMMGIEAIYHHKKKSISVKDNEHKVSTAIYLTNIGKSRFDMTETINFLPDCQ